jgi:hypothetical protein
MLSNMSEEDSDINLDHACFYICLSKAWMVLVSVDTS